MGHEGKLRLVMQRVELGIREAGYEDEEGRRWWAVQAAPIAAAAALRVDAVKAALAELVRRGDLLHRPGRPRGSTGGDIYGAPEDLGSFSVAAESPLRLDPHEAPRDARRQHAFVQEVREPGSASLRGLGFHERELIRYWRRREAEEGGRS